MFKHLLVPLDGSQLAESALPAAAYLAQTLGARVTLRSSQGERFVPLVLIV